MPVPSEQELSFLWPVERSDVQYPPLKQGLGCGSAPGILMALLVFHGVGNASTTSTSVEPPHVHSFPRHTSAACVSISLEGQGSSLDRIK